ncbi:unnamed protein product [Zymoseptoria tritici ST99CH_3D7]|uniref:Uncharacterized protein n=1 Tax=Zymoseptoria tritici (strain ST99CH_3D7) TaxID=1276538 RepID=A0A1X7S2Y0_ZYMT9|nr:unnamed protein product [Zymoseptoria tritici ST99CH_3D7]
MRSSLFTLAFGAILTFSQVRAQIAINLTSIAELPECITTCGTQVLPSLNCAIGAPCYCDQGGPVYSALTACVISKCKTTKEALKGQQFQANSCGWIPHKNAAPRLMAILIAFLTAATLFLIARLASRWPRWGGAGYGWDDIVAVLSFIPIAATFACGFGMIHNGLGQDVWTLPIPKVLTWELWFFSVQPIYVLSAYSVKTTLILLYLRVWREDASNRKFRLVCKGIGCFVVLAAIAAIMATTFGCVPIAAAWRYTNQANGACINRVGLAYYSGSMNVILDIIIIILPIPKVLALKITTKQKIGLISCFLVGFAVTACAIVRLTTVHKVSNITNATWDFLTFAQWSGIELSMSMICCCMPAMAGFLKRCFRYMTGKSSHESVQADKSLVQENTLHPEKTYDSLHSEMSGDVASVPTYARKIVQAGVGRE